MDGQNSASQSMILPFIPSPQPGNSLKTKSTESATSDTINTKSNTEQSGLIQNTTMTERILSPNSGGYIEQYAVGRGPGGGGGGGRREATSTPSPVTHVDLDLRVGCVGGPGLA